MTRISPKSGFRSNRGFTLSELLVVVAIITLMGFLVTPALNGLKDAGDVTKTAYDIAGVLEQARAYAMSNNTYVFVGFEEVNATVNSAVSPQTATYSPTIGGRLAVSVVASQDGTRGYDATPNPLTLFSNAAWGIYANGTYTSSYNNGSNLVEVRKLQRFDGVHLATTLNGSAFTGSTVGSGGMVRPAIPNDVNNYSYVIGQSTSATSASVTPFEFPLGGAIGSGQYSFKNVINFDPQGVARIQYAKNGTASVPYIEIGLQPAHANVLSNSKDIAAIQIDGTTGAIRIYRP